MAFKGVEIRADGSLYCDMSIESMGFPSYTPLCSLPIRYDSNKFKEMGEIFVGLARSTCPVDTGFLRDHNDFHADAGGIEMWSEATYSAYQEYGTSRCRAQPWFESSIQSALADSGIEDNFKQTETRYAYVDGELSAIQLTTPTSIYECQSLINRIENLQRELFALGISVEGLQEELENLQWQVQDLMTQLMVAQMMNPKESSWIEQMIIGIIAGMVGALIRFVIENITGDMKDTDVNPHNPTH